MKLKKSKNIILLCLFLALIFQIFFTSRIESQAAPIVAIQERLAEISLEEKKVLEELFIILQDIQEAEAAEELLTMELEILNEEIAIIEKRLQEEETAFRQKLGILQEVLKGYQKRGSASYLHIVLSSKGLSDLIKRINIIREFTRKTGGLLEEMDRRKELLSEDEAQLSNKLIKIEDKQLQLREKILVKAEAKRVLEEYLTSLGGEGQFYEENLAFLQKQWSELPVTLAYIEEAITGLIADNNLPPEALKISYGLFNARVAINQEDFNKIFKNNPYLTLLEFTFTKDKVILSAKDKGLELAGRFTVGTGNSIELIIEEGTFYNIPLEKEAIGELFKKNHIIIDLSSETEGNSIRSISVNDGYIELLVIPVLF